MADSPKCLVTVSRGGQTLGGAGGGNGVEALKDLRAQVDRLMTNLIQAEGGAKIDDEDEDEIDENNHDVSVVRGEDHSVRFALFSAKKSRRES